MIIHFSQNFDATARFDHNQALLMFRMLKNTVLNPRASHPKFPVITTLSDSPALFLLFLLVSMRVYLFKINILRCERKHFVS